MKINEAKLIERFDAQEFALDTELTSLIKNYFLNLIRLLEGPIREELAGDDTWVMRIRTSSSSIEDVAGVHNNKNDCLNSIHIYVINAIFNALARTTNNKGLLHKDTNSAIRFLCEYVFVVTPKQNVEDIAKRVESYLKGPFPREDKKWTFFYYDTESMVWKEAENHIAGDERTSLKLMENKKKLMVIDILEASSINNKNVLINDILTSLFIGVAEREEDVFKWLDKSVKENQKTMLKEEKKTDTKDSIQCILDERNKTHGSFYDNAYFSQSLKLFMEKFPSYEKLTFVQKEALALIVLKIGRILSGDPNHADSWDDIAGFSKLASASITHYKEVAEGEETA